jgi:regulator of nucleoside diphosphate kinase
MRQIIITESDRQNLETLLSSEFAKVFGPSSRFDELRAELARAQIVSPDVISNDVVTMNSKVVLRDLETDARETFTLVFPNEADIANGRLSILAPIGTAILGERIGDEIRWRVPDGWRRLKIEEVVSPSATARLSRMA